MNLDFSNVCKSIESETLAKRSDVSNLMDLNLSNCVKMKIMLKELERNFAIDNCNDLFFIKIVDGLTRITNELAVLSKLHYSFVFLEKYANAKRRRIHAKNLKRKEMRNKLKNIIQSKMKSVANSLQERALEIQELRAIFEQRKDEYAACKRIFFKNAVILESKKDLMESKEADKQSDFDMAQNTQESQSIITTVALQADQIDEDIAVRKKENQAIYQTFEHYTEIKFMIDDVGLNCDNLDRLLDEAYVEENAASEVMSDVDFHRQKVAIELNNIEDAYQAEISRLNDLYEYINESVQKAKLGNDQAKTITEQLKISNVETATMISMVQNEFRFWKSSHEDESDSELEEEEAEIEQLKKRITELQGMKFHP